MIKAYHLYTGDDGHSHVTAGAIRDHITLPTSTIHFEETPAHSSLDWHTAPTVQYVITLAGVLEFTTHSGETFTVHPGEILIAMDTTGSGHKWRLINDEPWKRGYVAFSKDEKLNFQPDSPGAR
jgi:quercetin dioxygenase-like cupin family protein